MSDVVSMNRYTEATFEPEDNGKLRRAYCAYCLQRGVKNFATHRGVGNGYGSDWRGREVAVSVTLTRGCEWHMRLWSKGRLVDRGE